MTNKFDAIIIGAGHNGLVCAAYLAKAGKKVLVLERAAEVGGAAGTHEFAKGFKVSTCAHILHAMQPKIIKDLELELVGADLKTISIAENGNHLILGPEGLESSHKEANTYRGFIDRVTRHAKALAPQLLKTPPRLADFGLSNTLQLAGLGWNLRFGLGKKRMQDFMRIIGMNIHDLVDEVFEDEALKASLSFDAVLGTAMEPRMPGSVLSWIYRLAHGLENPMTLPKGGMGSVAKALANAAENNGALIRTTAPVKNILLESGKAKGVVLEGGEKYLAPTVISNADPKTTFLKLVGARNLEAQFAHRIKNIRCKGRVAKVHIALKELPNFMGLDEKALANRLIIAPNRRYIEKAFNPSKYGELPKNPVMELTIPTLADPELAPKGEHIMSLIVQTVPFEVKGGWDNGREVLAKNVVETLCRFAPDLKEKMTALECLGPKDIEARFGITGGHWHHGELALDQIFMLRPTYQAAQYKTPIGGLYLCGAGSHPGGGVSGAPGYNAARAVLKGDR
jgi:phytoene dehydrogenase-like protein